MKREPTSKSVTADALDVKITHCLQVAPRASFAVIGSVLDVSEQTVARRYRRLRAAGAVRVIGFADPTPFGRQNWMLRLFCRPDAAVNVGRALAARDDTQWVAVMGGGTEVYCVLRPRTLGDQDQLLLRQLPRTVPVTGIEAAMVLHVFRGSTTRDWRIGETFLTAADEARLGAAPARTDRRVELTSADESLLSVLMADGRATYAELRAAVGGDWTEARIRRRVNELREASVLYFDVDIDEVAFGMPLSTRIMLTVAPAQLHSVGEALGAHPAVRFCGATTGATSLIATVAFADSDGLYRFISEDVGRLDGVAQVQAEPVTRILKRAGSAVDRDRVGG
ncbi:MAG TPA: AsnC family transcriptional regulator [Flexivirga sp.]|uniref:AsnC family transcriptional regulator n=1 Tax=Flexivirga sp. TaxID=1962927 RepID=UPI002B89FF2D|nr:AsnC family transcriptional regulator [Flexivirga sp.]HWC21498.1 AsnC family transcriptional regulator [Flexivirga sp.]